MTVVRITVLRRAFYRDLADAFIDGDRFPGGFGLCSLLTEGQSFAADSASEKPADFPCEWAWTDIRRTVALVMSEVDRPWFREPGKVVCCCSDGLRPVSFLVERIPPDA